MWPPNWANVRFGSRLCINDFLETETKHKFKKRTFAATVIRPRHHADSIVARRLSASAFSHSLGQERTFGDTTRKVCCWG